MSVDTEETPGLPFGREEGVTVATEPGDAAPAASAVTMECVAALLATGCLGIKRPGPVVGPVDEAAVTARAPKRSTTPDTL